MQFTITRPDGTQERVRHIPYTVTSPTPGTWLAHRKEGKKALLGRSTVSEAHLRAHCDTMTQPT